jgi:hypothetical protein
MYDLLSNLNGWGLILMTAVGGGLVVLLVSAVTGIVTHHLLEVRESDNSTQLKQDMLDRGMSADEIKTVLEAGVKK